VKVLFIEPVKTEIIKEASYEKSKAEVGKR
jgi:hypothetical protein